MTWSGLVKSLFRKGAGKQLRSPPDGAYEPEIFRQILRRERARVDRNAHMFSVVVFDVGDASRASLAARRLVAELKTRTRFTDVIGCLDRRRIGLLLPETAFVGASKLATDIQQTLETAEAPLPLQVHTYPPAKDAPSDDPLQLQRQETGAPRQPISELTPLIATPIPRWKRLLDATGALLGLLILSPIFVLTTLLIKAVSPGPVFFCQRRVGYMGREFGCWKFRTMHLDADPTVHEKHIKNLVPDDAPLVKLDAADSRIIPFGRLLRATGIDELPQLYNVLKGDMSLIGPRPCIPYEANTFHLWQWQRFDTVPGLTGLWQVSGKNRTTFNQMMRYDVSYARKQTPLRDISILAKTLPVIARQAIEEKRRDRAAETHPGG